MMPAAPLVGAVTTRPPAAFSSLTASANRLTQSITRSGSVEIRLGAQPLVQLRRPARHLQPAGQRARRSRSRSATHSCITAQMSSRPLADLVGRPPGCLVREHHAADRQSGLGAARRAAPRRWGTGTAPGVVGLDPVRAGGRLVDDEAAADRVVRPLAQHGVVRAERDRSACRSGGTAATCAGAAPGRPRRTRASCLPSSATRPVSPHLRRPARRPWRCRPSPAPRPSRPRITARSLPWPCPVAPSEPNSSARTRARRSSRPSSASPVTNVRAARIGPTVCELRRADADREQVEHADGHSTIVRRKARASETHGDQPPDGTANGQRIP